jgi:hypothetical protein
MLLEEVNANHEGTYDFFYLPIDFKNKCNVGYGVINFLEPKFIIPFVNEFEGARWRNFNSEKVCSITFARIQGKAAMVARFQNSSLLDKDDEYRPLLFYSTGPQRGLPEPFPIRTRQNPMPSVTTPAHVGYQTMPSAMGMPPQYGQNNNNGMQNMHMMQNMSGHMTGSTPPPHAHMVGNGINGGGGPNLSNGLY